MCTWIGEQLKTSRLAPHRPWDCAVDLLGWLLGAQCGHGEVPSLSPTYPISHQTNLWGEHLHLHQAWRIKVGNEWKTVFSTTSGHYSYSVVPYGLVNATVVRKVRSWVISLLSTVTLPSHPFPLLTLQNRRVEPSQPLSRKAPSLRVLWAPHVFRPKRLRVTGLSWPVHIMWTPAGRDPHPTSPTRLEVQRSLGILGFCSVWELPLFDLAELWVKAFIIVRSSCSCGLFPLSEMTSTKTLFIIQISKHSLGQFTNLIHSIWLRFK